MGLEKKSYFCKIFYYFSLYSVQYGTGEEKNMYQIFNVHYISLRCFEFCHILYSTELVKYMYVYIYIYI
jgi:hypothetical protein